MARLIEKVKTRRIKKQEEVSSDTAEPVVRNWPLLALYFLAGLIVAVLVVFGARAIYHHAHTKNVAGNHASPPKLPNGSTNNPSSGSGSSGNSSSGSGSGSNSSGSSGASGGSSSTGSSSQGSSSSPTKTTPSPNSLPNSGPGNVIALFVGVSLAATGLHYIYQLRRQ